MEDLVTFGNQFEVLLTSLEDLAVQQIETLKNNDLDSLKDVRKQWREQFDLLRATVTQARDSGLVLGSGPDPSGQKRRLRQRVRRLRELDRNFREMVEEAMQQRGAEMETVRCGRLALRYRAYWTYKKRPTIDLMK